MIPHVGEVCPFSADMAGIRQKMNKETRGISLKLVYPPNLSQELAFQYGYSEVP